MQLSDLLVEIENLMGKSLSGDRKKKINQRLHKRRERERAEKPITNREELIEQLNSFYLEESKEVFDYHKGLKAIESKMSVYFKISLGEKMDPTFSNEAVNVIFNGQGQVDLLVNQAYEEACKRKIAINDCFECLIPMFFAHGMAKYEKDKEAALQSIQQLHPAILRHLLNTDVDNAADLERSLDLASELQKAEFTLLCLLQDYVHKRREEGVGWGEWACSKVGFFNDRTLESKIQAARDVQDVLVKEGLTAAAEVAKQKMTQGRSNQLGIMMVELSEKYKATAEPQASDSCLGPKQS